jgi:methionyl-tRNA formyltransferase
VSVIRVLFLGTPEFARYHLEHLLNDEHYKVVGVVSQPDRPRGRKMQLTPSPVKEFAVQKGLPVFTPEKASDPEFLEQINKLNAEAAIVVAFGQILRPQFLQMFPNKVVNVHGSVLPKLRGAAPIQRTLMNNDTDGGVSLQVMVDKLDAGPVIGARKLAIPENMDALELHNALMPLGFDLLHVDLMDYLRGNLIPLKQNEDNVTFAPKIKPEEEKLNWQNSALEIHNIVRGLALQGGAYTILEGKRFKIHKTIKTKDKKSVSSPGQIEVKDSKIFVACGDQIVIELLVVQPEGKPRMSAADFLKGASSLKLERFTS